MTEIEVLQKVINGSKWKIDLENKVCKVDGKEIELQPYELPTNMVIEMLNKFYLDYKYSYPSERSERNADRYYFRALSADEMTDEEMIVGADRETARAKLELFVLLMAMSGSLKSLFTNDKQWFWKGNNGLVIMKGWC